MSTFSIARQFSFIGKTLIVALALSLLFFTLASAQSQGMDRTKGATGKQVKVCVQQRNSNSVFRTERAKDTTLTWKSSCGGYAHTTLDGNNEYANFSCGDGVPGN